MITLGLALPHYDGLFPSSGVTGADRTHAALSYAQRAEKAGFHQVWVSDHLWLELDYRRRSPDCWTLLAAIAATTRSIRLGSLVTPAPLREPALLAHQVAAVVDLAGPRLDVGLGAGWYAPEFADAGRPFEGNSERLAAVGRTAAVLRSRLGSSAPPIWIGGKRTGILTVAAQAADGWNLSWDPTPADYTRRLNTLLESAGREQHDASTSPLRSVGLTTVVGTDEADLRRRWKRLRDWVPGGHLDSVSFEEWRNRGLIGTPDEVRDRLAAWEELGVDHVVCALGMPFGLFEDEQIELLTAAALQPEGTNDPAPLTQGGST